MLYAISFYVITIHDLHRYLKWTYKNEEVNVTDLDFKITWCSQVVILQTTFVSTVWYIDTFFCDIGLAPRKWQTIFWTKGVVVYRRIYASPGLDEFELDIAT